MRWGFLSGLAANKIAKVMSKILGIATMTARLSARLIKADGRVIDYGVLGYKSLTDAFVEFMVDNLKIESAEWGDFKFHDSGVGVTGEQDTDTDIETTDGESRATGTQIEGATAEIYKSVGTISYSTTKAITEHGLFSTVAGTTLMDRTVFSAINVVNGDSIQFSFELSCTAGG